MEVLYIAIFVFFFLGILFSGSNSSKSFNRAYLYVCFAIMLLLHSLVNPEYSDNLNYGYGYREFAQMSFGDVLKYNASSLKAEVGYRVFCKLLTIITPNWLFGLFVISVVILGGYFLTTERYSPSYLVSILLIMVGPFVQSTFVLRQHMAMAIILMTYPLILERRIVPYLFLCAIAFSIHQTALIFLPVYFLYNMSRNKSAVLMVILLTLFTTFFSFFLTKAGQFAMDTLGYGEHYFSRDMELGSNYKTAFLLGALLVLRVIILQKSFFNSGITRLMSVLMIIGFVISIAGIGFIGTNRMNMYFTSASFIYIPNTFYYLKSRRLRGIACFGYFLFMLYFFINNASDFEGIWFISPSL